MRKKERQKAAQAANKQRKREALRMTAQTVEAGPSKKSKKSNSPTTNTPVVPLDLGNVFSANGYPMTYHYLAAVRKVKHIDTKGAREIYLNLYIGKILEEFRALQIQELRWEREHHQEMGDDLPTTEDYDDDMDLYNWEAEDRGD
jgi:hypothetical protein